jgi:hypothetical protein
LSGSRLAIATPTGDEAALVRVRGGAPQSHLQAIDCSRQVPTR